MHPAAPVLDTPGLVRYGFPEFVRGTSPAAGADFSYAVEGAYYERIVSLHCKFVADANAASREVVVSYQDAGGLRFGLYGINTTVTASLTAYYEFSAFQPEAVATVDGSALVPLGPLLLAPTQGFKIHVVSIQATDQLSEIRFVRERFFTTNQPPQYVPHSGP